MQTETPQLDISRVVDAPRDLVYRAFTDPEHFAAWWGPVGNSLPRDEMDFDVRSGGHQRWTELSAADPGVRVHVSLDLTDVTPGELLDGLMHVAGRLPDGIAPFETRVRIEFHDEADGRTRLEIRQWLPAHQASNALQGWRESLGKLDAALMATPGAPSGTEPSGTEPSTTGVR
ncbi:SRPBCC family protein [Humibacter soli]